MIDAKLLYDSCVTVYTVVFILSNIGLWLNT